MFHSTSVSIAHFLPLPFAHRLGDRIEHRSGRAVDIFQQFFCIHIVIFGEKQRKSHLCFCVHTKARKRDVGASQGDEFGIALFLVAAASSDDAICRASPSVLGCKKRTHSCTVLRLIIMPDERLKLRSRCILRIGKIVKIQSALPVVREHRHACCAVLHLALQTRPQAFFCIRLALDRRMKKDADLPRQRLLVMRRHRTEKIHEARLIEAQFPKKSLALLDERICCNHGSASFSSRIKACRIEKLHIFTAKKDSLRAAPFVIFLDRAQTCTAFLSMLPLSTRASAVPFG